MKRIERRRAIVLLSGGIDSAACAHFLIKQGFSVSGLFVDYGQLAVSKERRSARKVASHFRIQLLEIRMTGDVCSGSYERLGRNALFAFAALVLLPKPQGVIALGIHSGTPYFDCSPLFFTRVSTLVAECSSGRVSLLAPFLDWEKSDIYRYCLEECIPIEHTYSCQAGSLPTCGECRSCKDREALTC